MDLSQQVHILLRSARAQEEEQIQQRTRLARNEQNVNEVKHGIQQVCVYV